MPTKLVSALKCSNSSDRISQAVSVGQLRSPAPQKVLAESHIAAKETSRQSDGDGGDWNRVSEPGERSKGIYLPGGAL